jgi:hypothetical protein
MNGSMSRLPFPHALRLAFALCAILAGGLLSGGAQAFAAEGGGQSAGEAPTIAGEAVSNVTEHDATLEAQINPNGLETTYEFHMTSYACPGGGCAAINVWSLPGGSIPAGSGDQAVSLDLNSAGVTLHPGTSYEYAVTASNTAGEAPSGGHWEGTEQSFKTLSDPPPSGPVSETGSASDLTQTSVTLAGSVNPRGALETTYAFEYGTTTAYGASAPTPPGVIKGEGACGIPCEITTPQPVSENLTGLEPGVAYHYRLVSSGARGVSYGQDATFTTAPLGNETETPSSAGSDQPTDSPIVAVLTPIVIPTTPITTTTTTKPKVTGDALKLAKALKVCEKRPKKQRATCRKRAERKYATTARDTGKKASEQNRKRRR